MDKKIDVEQTIKAIIEQEGKEKGISLIRNIVNSIAKGQRKKKKRVNSYDSIAFEVYNLMFNDGYSRTRAIDKISLDKDLALSTVNNHLNNFSKQAKQDDYLNFGKAIDEIIRANENQNSNYYNYYYSTGELPGLYESIIYGKEFNFIDIYSQALYLKYSLDIKKKENHNFKRDYSKYDPLKNAIPF